jgi:hypothetical protein
MTSLFNLSGTATRHGGKSPASTRHWYSGEFFGGESSGVHPVSFSSA